MLKFDEIAPDIAAAMREAEEHEAACADEACPRCRRAPRAQALTPADVATHRRAVWAHTALASIPPAFDAARLDAPWLASLIGMATLGRAMDSLVAQRVVFLGPPGSGKTSLAVGMLRAVLDAEAPGYVRAGHLYVSAHALAKARAGHPLGHGEAPLVEAALRAPLLVLDELGGEDPRHASAVGEVVYERHAAGAATWVTTGVEPDGAAKAIAARYGGGIARRVFEGAVVFRLAGRRGTARQ